MASFVSPVKGIVATGLAQGTAFALSNAGVNQVSTCTSSANGVKLPISTTGQQTHVINNGVYPLSVYPQAGGQINTNGTNVAYQIAVGQSVIFTSLDGISWTTTGGASGKPVVNGTASIALTAAQSGLLINVASAAAASVYTLPPAAPGLHFEIGFAATPANAVQVDTGAVGNLRITAVATNATAVVVSGGSRYVNFSNATSPADSATFTCFDGVHWICKAQIAVNTTLTTS